MTQMPRSHVDVAVIGAGPAGITAAYQLAKAGVSVALLEAAPAVGGMSRTIDLWGQKVDLGPHRFFSSDARVNELWLEVVGRDYAMVERLTRIYYGGKFFDYPLKAGNAFTTLGPVEMLRCFTSYARTRMGGQEPSENASFEEWVVSRFGRRLFEIFFKTYSEKLWGIPCTELDADFAAQRIKKLSLLEAAKNALGIGGAKHKTLVDRFAYPVGGTGMVYERMEQRIRELGGDVRLSTPVRRVLHDDKRVVVGVELGDDTVLRAGHVISTMPMTHMVRSLGDVPAHVQEANAKLTFRNTILVYLEVEGKDLFPDQWLYVHSPDLLMGRVTNFRNWVPQILGTSENTILALEYWANDDDAIWREDEETLVRRATLEIGRTGLTKGAKVTRGKVVRVPRCYPVYRRGYREPLQVVVDHLKQYQGLTPIGRYGAFKYNNQDHSILMGMMAAERIAKSADVDLWGVNTDYETYQEAAIITETGLQPA